MLTRRVFDAWPANIDGPAFLTTFNFDPDFFEVTALAELARRGAWPIVVLVDRRAGYAPAVELFEALREAGRSYLLVPVDLGRDAFHAKVHLFPTAGVCLVGSGNLTPGGLGRNLEVFARLDSTSHGDALAGARAFLRRVLADSRATLPEAERARLRGLLPEAADPRGGDVTFLHTLDGPLAPRIEDVLASDHWTDLVAAAPFHDPDHHTTLALAATRGRCPVRVAAERARRLPKGSAAVGGRLTDPGERPLHAKLVHVTGDASALLVVGSANLTRAAWEARNVEAIVVEQRLSPTAFQSLFQDVEFEPGAWDRPRPEARDDGQPALPPVPATWARLDAGRLFIDGTALPGLAARLESGGRSELLLLVPTGPASLGGVPPFTPERSAVVRLTAPGHRDTVLLVAQATRRRTPARQVLQEALRQLAEGARADGFVDEVRGRVVELLRRALSPEEEDPDRPLGARDAGVPVVAPVADAPMLDLEDVLLGTGPARAGAAGNREGLLRLVDLITGVHRPKPGSPTERRWNPNEPVSMGEVDGEAENDDEAERRSGADRSREEHEREQINAQIADVRAILDLVATGRATPDRALVAALQRWAAGLAESAHKVPEAAEVALCVLEDAWGGPIWPDPTDAWLARPGAGDLPDPAEALATAGHAAWVLLGQPMTAEDFAIERIPVSWRDTVTRVFRGVAAIAGPPAAHPEGSVPAGAAARLRAEFGERATREEEAEARVGPLWRAEGAAIEREIAKRKLADIARLRSDADADGRRYASRNPRHAAAIETIGKLTQAERGWRAEHERAERVWQDARAATRLAETGSDAPSLVQAWDRVTPRRHRDSERRLVSARDGACGACGCALSPQIRNELTDARTVRPCPLCSLLLAAGPPPRWRHNE
ncbi:MAG: hypothetical protein Q8P41_14175 [Pseudomonadota bacterium]|nr:hypothetical protein [Pseudomonadota bacterium]